MAKFKKGQSGNLNGRPKDVLGKKLRVMSAEQFAEAVAMILEVKTSKLSEIIEDTLDSHRQLERMVAAVVSKIIEKGDMHALNILLDRIIGKVKSQVEIKAALSEELREKSEAEIYEAFKEGLETYEIAKGLKIAR